MGKSTFSRRVGVLPGKPRGLPCAIPPPKLIRYAESAVLTCSFLIVNEAKMLAVQTLRPYKTGPKIVEARR